MLLPETELSTNCYNFPEDNFGRHNSVKNSYGSSPHLMLEVGAPAVDFTLHDIDGTRWNLGEVLEAGGGKPVILIFGMLSCPAYEGLDSAGSTDRWTYWHEKALVRDGWFLLMPVCVVTFDCVVLRMIHAAVLLVSGLLDWSVRQLRTS